jgi:hypothetical protein
MDALVIGIYHRAIMLKIDAVDVGIGWSGTGGLHIDSPLVAELSVPADSSDRSAGQQPQANTGGVVIWPLDGAEELPTHMGYEFPNPVPSQQVEELGLPASIMVFMGTIYADTFVMSENSTGAPVPAFLLTRDSDPVQYVSQSFIGLIPTVALKINTEYRVDFVGSIKAMGSSSATQYMRTWRFRTGELAYPAQR